jgi:hypothetical protein
LYNQFKEIIKAQIIKEDSVIEKYNIDKITSFMRTLLVDQGEAYKRSKITQAKVLIGSIFPSGLSWNYNGTFNHKISPIYQSIFSFRDTAIPSGAGYGSRTRLCSLEGSC